MSFNTSLCELTLIHCDWYPVLNILPTCIIARLWITLWYLIQYYYCFNPTRYMIVAFLVIREDARWHIHIGVICFEKYIWQYTIWSFGSLVLVNHWCIWYYILRQSSSLNRPVRLSICLSASLSVTPLWTRFCHRITMNFWLSLLLRKVVSMQNVRVRG